MTQAGTAQELLAQAESDLKTFLHLLRSAGPDWLAHSGRLLDKVVQTLGRIAAAAQSDPSLPLRPALSQFLAEVRRARQVLDSALRSAERQIALRGLSVSEGSYSVGMEA